MTGKLTLDTLKELAKEQSIDTVIASIVDMQGRLMGKRFHVSHFLESAWEETHCCDYLLATDIEMATPDGYAATSWKTGYGDYTMRPDMDTLRLAPWAPGTALVLCDVLDHHTHEEVPHSPRAMLKKQLKRLESLGLKALSATELEFFLFKENYEEAREKGYMALTPISPYNEDYHIFQTAKEESVMRAIRNQLFGAGIPVENTKGEAEAGQAELNIRYADALTMADNHSIAKEAVKEIAHTHGRSLSFLAKLHKDTVGSSSHVHQSLVDVQDATVFFDESADYGMSETMCQYLAGQLKYAKDITYFLAPYVNSYKRFAPGTFAPTRIIWSNDNRTAGFRIVGTNTPGVRIECRIGGSDLNPYLALTGLMAAGIAGIENNLPLESEFTGDAYAATEAPEIPNNLKDAATALSGSTMLRTALGDGVVDHYVRAAHWELEEFDRVVTDYELQRGFERV